MKSCIDLSREHRIYQSMECLVTSKVLFVFHELEQVARDRDGVSSAAVYAVWMHVSIQDVIMLERQKDSHH